jgi:hypothetical protein
MPEVAIFVAIPRLSDAFEKETLFDLIQKEAFC